MQQVLPQHPTRVKGTAGFVKFFDSETTASFSFFMPHRTQNSKFDVDRAFLAQLFNVSERAINLFVGEGMPRLGHGKYHLPTCVQWFLAHKKRRPPHDDSAQVELLRAQRAKIELQVAQMRGELLEAESARLAMDRMASAIASQMDSLAARMAGEIADIDDAAAVEARLHAECRAIAKAVAMSAGEFGKFIG